MGRTWIGWGVLMVGALGTSARGDDLADALSKLSGGRVLEHIKVLASDAFEGRGPGTPGEEKTVAYLTDQFQEIGLKPGNPDGTYVQDVPLVGFEALKTSGSIQFKDKTIDLKSLDDWVAVSRKYAAAMDELTGANKPKARPSRQAGRRRLPDGLGPLDEYDRAGRLRRRLRRLRRGRPRVRLGRLQGGGRQGQDGHHADQRPGRARPRRPLEARPFPVQGEGHDLLRPLDLQVRDRLARRGPRPA